MKQRFHLLTLGVNDLARSSQFYQRAFGWQTQGITGTEFEHGAVVFFNLEGGIILSLYERKNLAWDSALTIQPPSPADFSIGHLVNTDAEVDRILAQAARFGATITKPAQKTFWGGYAGYLKDPDGHLWEIAHNPAIIV